MSESGFEVAKAWVGVSPDAAEFASELDEQVGGLQVAITVVPNTADFAAMVDEQLGGLSTVVGVQADTGPADEQISSFRAGVDDTPAYIPVGADTELASEEVDSLLAQLGALDATLNVGAETGDASGSLADLTGQLEETQDAAGGAAAAISGAETEIAGLSDVSADASGNLAGVAAELGGIAGAAHGTAEALGAGLSGGIAVPVTPDVSDLQEALSEEAGGLVVSATVVPDTANLQEQLDAEPEPVLTVQVGADTAPAMASVEELETTIAGAGTEAAAASSRIADLEGEFSSLEGQLDALEARFGALSGGLSGVSAESSEAAAALENVERQFAAVGEEVTSLGTEVAAAGGELDGLDTQIGLVSGMVGELRGNLAAAEESVDEFGMSQFTAVAGVQAFTDVLGGEDAALDATAASADAASASAGHMGGAFGILSGVMGEVAANPFTWVAAATAGGILLGVALDGVTSGMQEQIATMARQDQATGYNISGYEKLAGQLGALAEADQHWASTAAVSTAQQLRAAAAAQQRSQEEQQELTVANNVGDRLQMLQSEYGLTAQQAEELASAAGVSASQLGGSGEAADKAMAKIEAYANANEAATGPVSQLTQDAMLFGDSALSVSTQVGAMDDAYSRLAGNFTASQQASLTVAQDFLNIEAGAQTAGASMTGVNQQSLALQQAFYATVPAIEQTGNAMKDAGDSASQVTAYIDEQITKLSGLAGGNAQAQQAVAGLKAWEDRLTGSLDTADASILKSASNLQDNFITQLEDAGAKSQATKTDVDELTDSILATGTKSAQTAADRAQLIADLVKAGVEAGTATRDVDAFIKSIGNIPSSKTVSIIETATGTWTINEAQGTASTQGAGGNTRLFGNASGGLITGGSRHPRADDIPALLSHGEYVVQASAVSKYGTDFMDHLNAGHYADGGMAGGLPALGSYMNAQYQMNVSSMMTALEAAVRAGIAAAQSNAQTSGKPPVNVNFYGTPQVASPEMMHAMTTQLSAAVGVS